MAEYYYKTEAIYRLLKTTQGLIEKTKKKISFSLKLEGKHNSWQYQLGHIVDFLVDKREVKISHYDNLWNKYFHDNLGDKDLPEFIRQPQEPWDRLCEVFLVDEKIRSMEQWCNSNGLISKRVYKKDWQNETAKEGDEKLAGCWEGFFLRTPEVFKKQGWHVGRCWLMITKEEIFLKSTVWPTSTQKNRMITKHALANTGFVDIVFHSKADITDATEFPFQFNFRYKKQKLKIKEKEAEYLTMFGTFSGYHPNEELFIPVGSSIIMRQIDKLKEKILYEEIENSFKGSEKDNELQEKYDYTGILKVHEFAKDYPDFFKFLKENSCSGTAAFVERDDHSVLHEQLVGDYSMIILSADFMKIRRLVLRIFSTGYCLLKGYPDNNKNEEYVYEGKVYHDARNQITINTYKRYIYQNQTGEDNTNDFEIAPLNESKSYYCYSFNTFLEEGYNGDVFSGLRIGLEPFSNFSLSACRFLLFKEDNDFFDKNKYEEVPILPYKNSREFIIKKDKEFNIFEKINRSKLGKINPEDMNNYYGNSDKVILVRKNTPSGNTFEQTEDYKINYYFLAIFYYLLKDEKSFTQYFKRAVIHGLKKKDATFVFETNPELKQLFKDLNKDNFIDFLNNLPTISEEDWINFINFRPPM